jgi:hypothetical protein
MARLLGQFRLFSLVSVYMLLGARVLAADEGVRIVTWMTHHVKFDTGGWLLSLGSPEDRELGWPIISSSDFYAQKNGEKTIKISSPNDMKKLRGLSITSDEGALDFVRLFTTEDEDVYSVFSSPRAVERDSRHTTVVRDGNSYVVKRMLVYVDEKTSGTYPLYEVEEKVARDGTYSIKKNRLVRRMSGLEAAIRSIE